MNAVASVDALAAHTSIGATGTRRKKSLGSRMTPPIVNAWPKCMRTLACFATLPRRINTFAWIEARLGFQTSLKPVFVHLDMVQLVMVKLGTVALLR